MVKQTNPSNHVIPASFLYFCFLFYFLPLLFPQKYVIFNEKSKFDLVHVFVKIKSISSPETITDTMGQILSVMKGLAYDNTSSVTINIFNESCDVP